MRMPKTIAQGGGYAEPRDKADTERNPVKNSWQQKPNTNNDTNSTEGVNSSAANLGGTWRDKEWLVTLTKG